MGADNADNRNEQNLLRQGYEGREDAKETKDHNHLDQPTSRLRRLVAGVGTTAWQAE